MLVRELSKRASRNAGGANTTRDFWAVLQANSARMTTQLQRFPRSAKPAPRNTRGKPPRSPNPWQNRRPFPAEPPRSRGGVPAGKAAGAVTINISLELGRVLGRWNSHPRVQSSVANIMNNEKSPCRRNQGRFRFASSAHPRADDRQLLFASLSARRVARSRRRRSRA